MQQVDALFEIENQRDAPIAADELRQLQQRSDAKGLLRLVAHGPTTAGITATRSCQGEIQSTRTLVLLADTCPPN